MIIETKYEIGDWIWFMSYRAKKVMKAPIMAIEVNVKFTDKKETTIRYQILANGTPSYFHEFQLFESKELAKENSFQPHNRPLS